MFLLALICLYDKCVELRQLVYFDAIVRHGGFTRAANALHVAQPAISAQMQQLETELGVRLLARTTRRVGLTPAGGQFLTHVHVVLGELDAARAKMSKHAEVATGRVRIGTTPVTGDLPLPQLLADFRRTFPGVRLELRSGLIADLLDRLADGELDLVIGPDHGDDARFDTQPVAREGFRLITPPGYGREVTRLSDVVDQPFVCLPQGSGLWGILHRAAEKAGFTPLVAFETHTPSSVRELVSAGMGIALVASSAAGGGGPPVGVHRLEDAPEHPDIAVFRHRSQSNRATQVLYELLAAEPAHR